MTEEECYVFWLTDPRFSGFIDDILNDLPHGEAPVPNGTNIESMRRRLTNWRATETYHGAAIALMMAQAVKGNRYATSRARGLYDILSTVSSERDLMDRATSGQYRSVAMEQLSLIECYDLPRRYLVEALAILDT